MANVIYIGTSIDGYIADRNGGLDFLSSVPVPEGEDLGFADFMDGVDAVLMGRVTFETVLGFGVPWSYTRPVFVYSKSEIRIPDELEGRVEAISGSEEDVLAALEIRGYRRKYIDGGSVIQSFLRKDLIDEMIIARIPVLLGGGTPQFRDLPEHLAFDHVSTEVLADQIVRTRYWRRR